MIHIDPQQEIFTAIKIALENLGYSVYDGVLPPEDTPYPFVYLGDNQQVDTANKTAVFGNVYQTIHVWHSNPKQRGTVSKMLLDVKTACREIKRTANFSWMLVNANQQITSDNTTAAPLLHGYVDAEFKFS